MIRSKRARDRQLALIDKDCGSKSTVYDPRYPMSAVVAPKKRLTVADARKLQHLVMPLKSIEELAKNQPDFYELAIQQLAAPPMKIRHLKMPVMAAHEPQMLTNTTSGLHPRIGEPYRRLKMLSADDVAWDRNPCGEVELPSARHPAIEMKMQDYEDMMLDYNQYCYDIPV